MSHYNTFLKKGYITLIADNEIVEVKYFSKRTKYKEHLKYFKNKVKKSSKICEFSVIYDNDEVNRCIDRIKNYTDKRTLKKLKY